MNNTIDYTKNTAIERLKVVMLCAALIVLAAGRASLLSADPHRRVKSKEVQKVKKTVAKREDVSTVKNKKSQKKKNKDGISDPADKKEIKKSPFKNFQDKDFRPKVEEESYGWMIFKTLLVLGSLVGGFYYFFRFVTRKAGIEMMGGQALQVLSVIPIGQNKYIQLLDCAGKILIIGVTDNNINLITEITEKEQVDRLRLASAKSSPVSGISFQEQVMNQIGKVTGIFASGRRETHSVQTEAPDKNMDLMFLQKQKERLKRMNGENGDDNE